MTGDVEAEDAELIRWLSVVTLASINMMKLNSVTIVEFFQTVVTMSLQDFPLLDMETHLYPYLRLH